MGDLEAHYVDTDDDYGLVTLPFEMRLFERSSNQVFVSTNGVSIHFFCAFSPTPFRLPLTEQRSLFFLLLKE